MKGLLRIPTLVCLVLAAAGGETPAGEPGQPGLLLANQPGWGWQVEPFPFSLGQFASGGINLRLDDLEGGRLLATIPHPTALTGDIARLAPVAFDPAGRRFAFTFDAGSGRGSASPQAYLLDLKSLPLSQVKWIGVEKLTQDALRNVVAPAALRKLRDAGVEALPFPRLGARYEFSLTTLNGPKISSQDLLGKVVLLDFWASWCAPCMAQLPELKATYERLRGRGFEIVGLNHDPTPALARRTIAGQQLPWPNVQAPIDSRRRDLWLEASGTGPLPRLLIIDRRGILRLDTNGSSAHLQAEIERWLAQR